MPEITPSKYLVQAGWDDVPHLDDQTKRELWAATPPYLRDARGRGIPSLGAGAIYPIPLDEVLIPPFRIPDYWPRAYGLDVGWKRTAATWGARDPSDGVIYLYAEHYMGQAVPSVHADAVKARGAWIPGVIDPAARGRQQVDGRQLLVELRELGLDVQKADNSVEAGLFAVYQLLAAGRLKVFQTLGNLAAEYRLYRRDENGKVVKEHDHLMDAMRYLIVSGMRRAVTRPVESATIPGGPVLDREVGY